MSAGSRYAISYGKASVPFYRAHATPLAGLRPIPESTFTGRSNVLFAAEVDVEVFGDNFLPAYVEGDNRQVVATDSMKNYVLARALEYEGPTLEGFLDFAARGLLEAYPQMEALRTTGRELPFSAATVPGNGRFGASDRLFARSRADFAVAALRFDRAGGAVRAGEHRCGRVGLELLKVTGSAFTRFVRDQHTTLPERADRPLHIALDVHWRYADAVDALGAEPARYVAAEQVRDLTHAVFHEFVSESIQHLVHEIGGRVLERFPQLAEVSFDARNLTPDPVAQSESEPARKVYSAPFPAFGIIRLAMTRG